MELKETRIVIKGELKIAKKERNAKWRQEFFLNRGVVLVDGIIGGIGTGFYFLAKEPAPEFAIGAASFIGGVLVLYSAYSVLKTNEEVADQNKKIRFLRQARYELRHGINRFEDTTLKELPAAITKVYSEPTNKK